ncbi:hypothetical protein ES703_27600 [subsurface metagenome]
MNQLDLDALALEYQGDYGTARGELDISDVVNNPLVHCVTSVLRLGFPEELGDLPLGEICVLRYDAPNSSLVAQDTI